MKQKPPGQLDHASPHTGIARFGEPLLPPLGAALVGRACQASVASHGPPVAQIARQDLLHQHVRGLAADTDDARQQADHRMRAVLGPPFQSGQSGQLDLLDLGDDEAQPSHIAAQLGQRVRRQRRVLQGAQCLETLGRVAERRLEAADAEAGKLPFIRLTIRVRSPMRFSRSRCGRLASSSASVGMAAMAAMTPFATQPAEERALQGLGV